MFDPKDLTAFPVEEGEEEEEEGMRQGGVWK